MTATINGTPWTQRDSAKKSIGSVASGNLFTISGGPVRVLALVGQITTVVQTQANNTKLTHTATGGTAVDLCATLNITGAEALKVFALDGVKGTALTLSTDAGVVIASALHMPLILTAGVIALSCSATNTGAVDWFIEYEPLVAGATVVAA